MKKHHIDAWIALNDEGKPKIHIGTGMLAVYKTREHAKLSAPKWPAVRCAISYELPAAT